MLNRRERKKAVLTFPETHRAQGVIFRLNQSQKLLLLRLIGINLTHIF